MAEGAPGAILLLDRELNVVWANRSAAALTGLTSQTLVGTPWHELSLPWELGADLRLRLLAGERVQLEGAPHPSRDGSNRLLWAHLTPLLEAAGSPGAAVTAIACTFAEGAATQSAVSPELDYKAALESAQGGMWDLDLTQRAARRTEFYFRMLGDPPHDEPVGVRSWRTRVHPDDLQRVESAAQAVIEGRRPFYEVEYRYRHADGSWRWLLDRGRVTDRDSTGKSTRMVGFVVDITDRVRTQQALRQSEFRYRTVASMAPGFVFEHGLNPDGTAAADWASEGIEAVFGCKYEEIDSHGGWFALLDEQYRPIAAARQARLAMGEPQSGETKVHTVQGETKWLHVNMLPVRDPQTGRVTGVLGSAYDITTRKLAEQARLESEAVLRAVTQNTPDWLFLVDESLVVRFVNRQFGPHEPVTMVGRPLLDLVPEAHRPSLEELYLRVFASGRPGRIDLRHLDADGGNASHHEHRVVPVMEGGNVRSLTVAVTDVTERKRAEAALRESQMTLQTVAASSADWLALFDRQRRCIFLNRAFRGVPPEEWIDAPVESFAPPAERRRVHEIFEHVMNTGEPRDFDQMIVDSEHGPRYLELRARAVQADGRIFGAVVNITEVTDRHAQQDAMRTQAQILETMQEGVVLIDAASGAVKLTNPMFARMFGYDRSEELMGRSVESLFSTRALQRSLASRALPEGAPTEVLPVELECARKDGTRFVAACVLTPLKTSGANHWLAVFNDVTERKRLEREIIEVSNREQQRIGSDLHDGLGQELTGIALMLKGVVAQLRKEGSAARLDIEDVITLVNNAIESTRAMARGLSPVSGERGGLAAALQALVTRASERYGIHVTLDTDPDDALRLNEAAATHVYRIVQEALTNVIRHSSATEVEIRLYASGDEYHLTVDDNGRGFSQPDPESPGGLGLKIMEYRTQMLGGDLIIDTGVRGGASIHCSFPLERASVE